MNEAETMKLCVALMKADSEAEVIELLKAAGLWDDPKLWRFYGDYENNYNTIGNQQGRPDAALVEKLINSVDASLMGMCLAMGTDPAGKDAPKTIREAVARFYHTEVSADSPTAGLIKEWPDHKRTEIARGITLAATGVGPRIGNYCLSIADCGEGQTPEQMPDTLLSLNKSNKLRIPFVQGKFNMGGSGVFEFCGPNGLQLVLSRRNPAILKGKLDHADDGKWGCTVVRRENAGVGRRSSVYTYLAPVGPDRGPGKGGVLRFTAAEMPIFPEATKDLRDAYARNSEWGTLIKLYEYAAGNLRSNIIRSDPCLLGRLDLLLPELALPIRLYECRESYKGHGGSFATNLAGLGVRLEDDSKSNLEEDFPTSCPLTAQGEQMTATIYAFKKGKAETYRKHEGIIFTLNGQTHGHLTPDFFTRKAVGLSYLADSILVVVDCSKFSSRAREVLFMNSRDRLRNGELRGEIEDRLEEMLKQHDRLRALRERRRREQTEAKLADSKPLEDILESLLKSSPTLANLFLKGLRASNPFKTAKVREEEETPFVGKRFPTFFKFKGKDYHTELARETAINMRTRVEFETDAENDYFGRDSETGVFSLFRVVGDARVAVENYVGPNLQNGTATLSVQLPQNCQVGDTLKFVAVVKDPTLTEPFENCFTVKVKPEAKPGPPGGEKKKHKSGEPGSDREVPGGIALPNIIEVWESCWGDQTPPFDKHTALRIKNAGVTDETDGAEAKPVYDFYINMDNIYLNSELKPSKADPKLLRARFTYGMVLLGLALVQQDEAEKARAKKDGEEAGVDEALANVECRVAEFTQAVAPVLLPMIDSLGDLNEEEVPAVVGSGDAT
ncbi:MAG: hypothetical protein FJ304_17805 [Planctomycetes bacterium]|nr:hypothetical protein [Planctomycetota bacterium]